MINKWHRSATCYWFPHHIPKHDFGANPVVWYSESCCALSLDRDCDPSIPPVPITPLSWSEIKCAANLEFLGELSIFTWQWLHRESWVTTCWEENWIMFSSTSIFLELGNTSSLLNQTVLNYKILGQVP